MYGKITHLKNKIIIFISYFVALFLEPENAFQDTAHSLKRRTSKYALKATFYKQLKSC